MKQEWEIGHPPSIEEKKEQIKDQKKQDIWKVINRTKQTNPWALVEIFHLHCIDYDIEGILELKDYPKRYKKITSNS